jgi:hypothetical protein
MCLKGKSKRSINEVTYILTRGININNSTMTGSTLIFVEFSRLLLFMAHDRAACASYTLWSRSRSDSSHYIIEELSVVFLKLRGTCSLWPDGIINGLCNAPRRETKELWRSGDSSWYKYSFEITWPGLLTIMNQYFVLHCIDSVNILKNL